MRMKWVFLFLSLLALPACQQQPTAADAVAGRSTASAELVGTVQADQYRRDAEATLQARDQAAQALAWQLQATAVAATSVAAQAQTASALTWAMTVDAATAQAVATATQQARLDDMATVQAQGTATQQARLDAVATAQANGTATAVAAAATRQAYELARAEAEAAREEMWRTGTRIILIILIALLLAGGGYVLWRFLPTWVNRASVVKYGQHGNPLLVTNHNGQTVITDPIRMLQPSLRIGNDGQAEMPHLSPDDLQAYMAVSALRLLMEQAAHAPGHAPQLPAETITARSRRVGPVETGNTTTTRYAPPIVTQLPRVEMPASASAPTLPFSQTAPPPLLSAAQQPLALIDAALRRNEILLGIDDGLPIAVPARELCHVGIAGATGGGKSTVLRLLLTQLLAAGASVVLADPHYADVDPRSGDDWRTIRANLRMQPAFRYRDIRELLAWLVGEIDQRLAMRRSGQVWDTSLFLAFDEYPLIAQNVPEAADLVGRTLREGRKVDVFVLGAFQDALVRSLGGDGAVRENYRTAYYLGGDQHTARVLLDVRGRVDETHLGHGVALLRSPATTPAREVRVPRLSNEQIRALLPASTGAEALPGSGPEVAAGSGPEVGMEVDVEAAVRERRVLQLLAAGMSQNEIIRQLWNATGGRAYQEAAAVIREIRQRMEGENGQ